MQKKKYLLKMTESDYRFYDDQKTTTLQYCTLKEVPATSIPLIWDSNHVLFYLKKQKLKKLTIPDPLLMEVPDTTDSEV